MPMNTPWLPGHLEVAGGKIRVGGVFEKHGDRAGSMSDPETDDLHIGGKNHFHESIVKRFIGTGRCEIRNACCRAVSDRSNQTPIL
jgi:hypothetical protein